MSKSLRDVTEMMDLGLEEHKTGEISTKTPPKHRSYVLLYVPKKDKIVMGKLANTKPCLFGGGRDVTGREKDEETIKRELLEETGGCVRFEPGSLNAFYTSKDGLRRFYWTDRVAENVPAFRPNSEISKIGYARVKLGLVPHMASPSTLANAMLDAFQTAQSQRASFLREDTVRAIYAWVKNIYPAL
ncbi:MAG TPA: NUDIX hydrolase [Longimicrobium sp.]|jgi:hypothetical protein